MELRQVIDLFIKRYGGTEEGIRVFTSPGRVNLIGEHTDYNGGFVFPAAISMRSLIVLRPREDDIIRLSATDLEVVVEADIHKLNDYRDLKWGNYQLGVAYELQQDGYDLQGCDMLYDDTVPLGGGLSSSAAIQVATALAFSTMADEKAGVSREADMVYLAKVSQRSEHNYVGVKCGIMDQFASAMGQKNKAIFLNCKTLDYELVPVEIDGYKIVLMNTNKKRSLADSKYNERRGECEEGLAQLQTVLPDAECLGDISMKEFEEHKGVITNPVVRKRVEHVIAEDDRVLRSVEALKKNDLDAFGKLLIASHNSLRDLYEVTGIELDTLAEEAIQIDGCIGARMTGAGFGGCAVSIVREDAVEAFIQKIETVYTKKIGYAPTCYISDIGNGGREIKVF
ncbi:MAG: galactokinase [Ruminococcaceae bacterium]|nr:galactokinase [Oscillospiraceae bacterium]